MKISWNWLSELVDLGQLKDPAALAALLTSRGLEVEELHRLDQGFESVVTVKILAKDKHPQADRLNLCKVTTGTGDPLEIVCGAQNMKVGDTVALAQIGALLPNGAKIEKSAIRGVVSNGMLCSEDELGMASESEGILILPAGTPLGKPLAEVLGRNDTILTLKLTANRGDCLSHHGLAREVAAALGSAVKKPKAPEIEFKGSPIAISLDAGDSAPQFWGVAIQGVKIGPSPAWLVKRLEAVGSRSINNVVDATNYVMLEMGHPMHAYDFTRVEGRKIGVRIARSGEELPLLDGTAVKLQGWELVIADGARAVGLAGVMGGGNSEVQDSTTQLFLECAEFSPQLVRKAASAHQKKTEAAQRFEKGIDPNGARFAISRLAGLITELAGGKVEGAGVTALPSRDPVKGAQARKVELAADFIPRFLGLDQGQKLETTEIDRVLKSLSCEVTRSGDRMTVKVPSYRWDLNLAEDLAEEVARSVGYDRIPSTLPRLTGAPSPENESPLMDELVVMNRAKRALAAAGLQETVNLSFTSQAWLKEFQLASQAKLINPLSEEYEALVPSLLPGLMKAAVENTRRHFGSEPLPLRFFEIRPTYLAEDAPKALAEMETNVKENWRVTVLISGPRYASALRTEQSDVDFMDLKGACELLFESLGTKGIRLQPLSASRLQPGQGGYATHLFHPGQTAEVLVGNQVAGHLGRLHPGVARGFKLKAPVWIAELDWKSLQRLSRASGDAPTFKGWSEFPPMERDFALLVKEGTTADKITQVALKSGKPLAKVAKVFDIYRGSQVPQGMTSVAVRVIFFHEGRSLQESETEAVSAQILGAWKKELGAELRA